MKVLLIKEYFKTCAQINSATFIVCSVDTNYVGLHKPILLHEILTPYDSVKNLCRCTVEMNVTK